MPDPSFNNRSELKDIEQLTKEIRNGSTSALEQLLKLYGSALIAYSTQRTGNADIAEEIVQDVFLHLWDTRKNLESDYNLINYLYWLTRNKSIDAIRSNSKARSREEVWMRHIYSETGNNSENSALKNLDTIEFRTQVYDLLSAAAPKCREIFMLVWDAQLSYEEVGQRMNISVRTVRNQMSRAVKVLGERWERR